MLCAFTSVNAESGKPLKNRFLQAIQQPVSFDSVPRLKPEFTFSNTFANNYTWRSMTFNEGLMLQPALQVAYGNWELGAWSNIVAVETHGNAFIPELDFSLGYAFEGKAYGVKPQANLFFYPSNWEHIATLEIGAEAYYEMENIGFYINPNLDIADNYGGVYIDYGIYKSGDINPKLSYEARMLLGWGAL